MTPSTFLIPVRSTLLTEPGTGRNDEETLVVDDRGSLTPSQMVERKLIGWLKSSPLLVSQVQRQLKPSFR
jgi:hypothetical protein